MVDKASAGAVAAAIRPPDYRKAVQNIRALRAKKEKIQGINGEIADAWAKIEGMKVHRTAGKLFAKLDALEPADRADVIRSFNGLADASGWEKEYEDLADKAEGKVVDLRLEDGKGSDPAGSEESDAAAGTRPSPISKALGKARKHLGGAEKKPAAGKSEPDAMTG